jgi:hypothetical protein
MFKTLKNNKKSMKRKRKYPLVIKIHLYKEGIKKKEIKNI